MFTLLDDARHVLLNFGEPGSIEIAPWASRVRLIDAKYAGAWELSVFATVSAPTSVLIRPDGYVAGVGGQAQKGLADALALGLDRQPRQKRTTI